MKNKYIETKTSLALALAFLGGNVEATGSGTFGSNMSPHSNPRITNINSTFTYISQDPDTVVDYYLVDDLANAADSGLTILLGTHAQIITARTGAEWGSHSGLRYILSTKNMTINLGGSLRLTGDYDEPTSMHGYKYGIASLWVTGAGNFQNDGDLFINGGGQFTTFNTSSSTIASTGKIYVTNQSTSGAKMRGLFDVFDNATFNNNGLIELDGGLMRTRGTMATLHNGSTGVLRFKKGSAVLEYGTPNQLLNLNNVGKVEVELPLYKQDYFPVPVAVGQDGGIKELASWVDNQLSATFTVTSDTDQVIKDDMVFRAGVATAIVAIGGGSGKITLPAQVNTQGAKLVLKGAIAVTPGIRITASTVDASALTVLHLTQCPADFQSTAPTTKLVDVVTAAAATILPISTTEVAVKCRTANGRNWTGVGIVSTGADTNDVLIKPSSFSADPVMPIPVNAPWSLALAGAALVFFGRKRIQKALNV